MTARRSPLEKPDAREERAGIEKPSRIDAPNVAGMCFMFGASEEQVRRVLEEARHAEEEAEAEDWPQD
ncbi:hypothetical protein [Lentzea flaviverrucosa]|uniref:Uncharacterized protein n=1 Tax=Lentzea flaviverrucosa TaxID=200379 RepID=A0A1H9RSH9_9PSEU|nr:hypothetical protein [Lentzea flaviverrucosa]RDI33117.1 hypothetical protein DFR72_102366 [Lentzea flaviverrucosa]SER75405.1 hypothetical protein SAMN05216195_106368 [Lentzea flaviverrucosa]